MLQQLNVLLVVRGPKLNTALQVRPHQCLVQGHHHLSTPAGHTIPDASQDAVGLLEHLGSLQAHVQLAVDPHPIILFRWAAFQPLIPNSVVLHGVVVTQVQHLTLWKLIQLASAHRFSLSRSLCRAFLPWSRSTLPPNLVSSANLLREHSIPSFRSLIKMLNKTGPKTEPWGNTTCDRPPAGFSSIHHHSLELAI